MKEEDNLKNELQPVSLFAVKRYIIKNQYEPQSIFERWIVVGTEQEYLITEIFCQCYNFIWNKSKEKECKHIQLLKQSKKNKGYDEFVITTTEYEIFRKEWLQ